MDLAMRLDVTGMRWDYHVDLQGDALRLRDARDGDARHRIAI